jgi:predicted acetyltransferase
MLARKQINLSAQYNRFKKKIILANIGIYERTVDVDGRKMKRYWIAV